MTTDTRLTSTVTIAKEELVVPYTLVTKLLEADSAVPIKLKIKSHGNPISARAWRQPGCQGEVESLIEVHNRLYLRSYIPTADLDAQVGHYFVIVFYTHFLAPISWPDYPFSMESFISEKGMARYTMFLTLEELSECMEPDQFKLYTNIASRHAAAAPWLE